MSNLKMKLVIALFSMSLFGCITPYKSVTTGSRAKVTLMSHQSKMLFSVFKPEADANTGRCRSRELGTVKIAHGEKNKSVFLPAGSRINIGLAIFHEPELFRSYGTSSEMFSFVPQENWEYQIEYIDLGYDLEASSKNFNLEYWEYTERGKKNEWEIEYIKGCGN
ncbi:MAG: hypothetical protein NPIRA02_35240 [Nitrospirales bacterium]|nr:MAG: hypothetical protein NPIRA02_35240 [Nitrospirales bacterium]